ncbi:hypothetical protein B0H14DRAFT_2607317 [Mycena olivaceomarginata]|nr:hypothetical protein B0H14DRAFT_2607317 [Mycena olivaceomarginata]
MAAPHVIIPKRQDPGSAVCPVLRDSDAAADPPQANGHQIRHDSDALQYAMLTFLDMPSDILLLILSTFLEIHEILLLRGRDRETYSTSASARSIKGLKIFLDTWLLIVYEDGFVYLWDIREHAPRRGFYASLDLREPGVQWMSYAASLDPENEYIILAMSGGGTSMTSTYATVLYSVNIRAADSGFDRVQTFCHSSLPTILAIDTARRFLVSSSSNRTLDILCWGGGNTSISTLSLNDDDAEEIPIRPLKHHLPFPLHHRSVSVSDVVPVSTQIQDRRWKFNLLAYDGHSLAYYTVAIELPGATDATPTMDVTLIGEVRPPPTQSQPLTRSPWFVSAHALGPQAIRAMWVDRDNLTMTRHVRLCTLNRNDTQHEMDTASNVFSLASYDLRGEPFNQSRFADRVHPNYRGSDALRTRRTQWIHCLGKPFWRRLSSTSQTLAERVQLNVADEKNGAGQGQQCVNFYLNLTMMSSRRLLRAKPRFINGRLRNARSEYGEPCFGVNKKHFDFRKYLILIVPQYCGSECQVQHWKMHKKDCKHPYNDPSWQPAWMTEKRAPAIVADNGPPATFFGTFGNYLWGNVPAINCLQLARNEGHRAASMDLTFCFAASGDIRNVILTVNDLPDNYTGKCSILCNDINGVVVNPLTPAMANYVRQCTEVIYGTHGPYSGAWETRGAGKLRSLQWMSHIQLALRMFRSQYNLTTCARKHAFCHIPHDGVLAPFATDISHFTEPNRLLFSPEGGWLTMDDANPLFGWDLGPVFEYGQRHGATRGNAFGCLFFYLKEQFQKFAMRAKDFRMDLTLSQSDAKELSLAMANGSVQNFQKARFDRIETSNLADYLGCEPGHQGWGAVLEQSESALGTPDELHELDITATTLSSARPRTKHGHENIRAVSGDSGVSPRQVLAEGMYSSKMTAGALQVAISTGVQLRPIHRIHPKRSGLALEIPDQTIPNLTKTGLYDLFLLGGVNYSDRSISAALSEFVKMTSLDY